MREVKFIRDLVLWLEMSEFGAVKERSHILGQAGTSGWVLYDLFWEADDNNLVTTACSVAVCSFGEYFILLVNFWDSNDIGDFCLLHRVRRGRCGSERVIWVVVVRVGSVRSFIWKINLLLLWRFIYFLRLMLSWLCCLTFVVDSSPLAFVDFDIR